MMHNKSILFTDDIYLDLSLLSLYNQCCTYNTYIVLFKNVAFVRFMFLK